MRSHPPLSPVLIAAALLSGPATVGAYVVTQRALSDDPIEPAIAWAGTSVHGAVAAAQAEAGGAGRRAARDAETQAVGAATHLEHLVAELAPSLAVRAPRTVTVTADDTLDAIEDAWSTEPSELAALNDGRPPSQFGVGDELTVWRYVEPSKSTGRPNRGYLLNGVPMPGGAHWIVQDPELAWGTELAIEALVLGFTHVGEQHPGGGLPTVADISRRHGGRLSPHRSHRSGRDADITYYRVDPAQTPAWGHVSPASLDVARQWALFAHWIEREAVDYIFTSPSLLRALRDEARRSGASPDEVARIFGSNVANGVIRYERGHNDHFHVRFTCAPGDDSCRNR